MKKTMLLLVLLAQSLFAAAQLYVEGVKLEPANTGQYLEIDPLFREDGSCAFQVDYGQSEPKKDFVSDVNGKRYHFRSVIDGLNLFFEEGWVVDQIYVMERGRRYLLKRRY
ncbi:MAG: hypothetical protein R3A50_18130 [Saprospiraceae bacterium]|nr:hypothetical protein [Saprospiraceae bacterium]MCB9345847.1 hypothetical protein [Lewinellaceae bacterium]